MAERTSVPDAGVPDRWELPAPVAHRAGANGAKSVELFPHAGQGALGNLEVRVQRYVAAVPEGDREEGEPGGACAGPVPHYGQDEQGDRRGPCGGGEAFEAGRL